MSALSYGAAGSRQNRQHLAEMSMSDTFRIRATRASPPGYAHDDEERRRVYCAALAQFDELISAAAAAGPASRPLPLFYALSQAGRAISAAHAEDTWRLGSHGLSARELGPALLDVEVKRMAVANKDGRPVDSMTGVAAATQSEVFAGAVAIDSLWASLPELFELLPASLDPGPLPLLLVPDSPGAENVRLLTDSGHVYATVVGFSGTGDELARYLVEQYPTADDPELYQPQRLSNIENHTEHGAGFLFRWQADAPSINGHVSTLNRVAPGGAGFEARWLRPAVGGVALSSLLTWWVLLFGLSMLARYEPAGWTKELDYDSSDLAAPLGELLEIGLLRVPELVLAALLATSEASAQHSGNGQ
jgi:hypothetical protein